MCAIDEDQLWLMYCSGELDPEGDKMDVDL